MQISIWPVLACEILKHISILPSFLWISMISLLFQNPVALPSLIMKRIGGKNWTGSKSPDSALCHAMPSSNNVQGKRLLYIRPQFSHTSFTYITIQRYIDRVVECILKTPCTDADDSTWKRGSSAHGTYAITWPWYSWSSVNSFTYLLAQSHSLNHLMVHSLNHPLNQSINQSITHLPTHSISRSLAYPIAHSLRYSLAHFLTHPSNHLMNESHSGSVTFRSST